MHHMSSYKPRRAFLGGINAIGLDKQRGNHANESDKPFFTPELLTRVI